MSKQIRVTLTDNEYIELQAAAIAFAATTRDTWTIKDEARSRVVGADPSDDPRQEHIYEWAVDRYRAGLRVDLRSAATRLREFDQLNEASYVPDPRD